ncbi:hypothetical protein [Arcobacter arenosus]|uniref:hypothetical protein n=1 Tax=Arcobacter arenosus TaxID=2576037 RepID=UPI001484D81D|nr:hypothetical protein [Arcobacter arenosus]
MFGYDEIKELIKDYENEKLKYVDDESFDLMIIMNKEILQDVEHEIRMYINRMGLV